MFKLLMIAALATVAIADPVPMDCQNLNPLTPNGRIVGGEKVDIREVPHQVSLHYYGFGFCGGTMISKDWVLTAAHCAIYSTDYVTVRAGTAILSSGGSIHSVKQFIKHKKYRTNQCGIPLNDIALVELHNSFQLDSTRTPIKMFDPNEGAVGGTSSMITGWGTTSESGSAPDVLQKVYVPIVRKGACNHAYKRFGGLPAGQICAGFPKGGKDACQGDSGGPLTIGGRLAGITSWGNGCARPGYPGVYTEIASYRGWIRKKTGL